MELIQDSQNMQQVRTSTSIFDTNILLWALLSTNGNPFRCLALARIGQVESVIGCSILSIAEGVHRDFSKVDSYGGSIRWGVSMWAD